MADELRENPALIAFVSLATRYCVLLEHPVRDRDAWLTDLHSTLAALYAAAPVLLQMEIPDEAKDLPQSFKLTNDEWTSLYTHLNATLGELANYAAFSNPVAANPATDQPTTGDLADDLADIYRDIRPGLTAFNSGDDAYLHHVLYDWLEMGYRHHWGPHATAALR